jgi:Ca-activated chloride channel family protein
MRQRHVVWALALLLVPSLGWLESERSRIVEGNRLLNGGKPEEAVQRYGEALLDDPDSPLLHYNLGNAHYKAGQYSEALASYGRVRAGEDNPKQLARVAYNAGNTHFRQAAAQESEKPQEALKGYAQALVAYRRALGADHTDEDAKFNYELTLKRIADLKKKIEEQKKKEQEQKEQEQQQQEQQQPQDQQQEQPEQQDEQDRENGKQQPSPEEPNQSREPEEDQGKPQPQPESAAEDQQDETAPPEASDSGEQQPADEPAPQSAGGAGESGEASKEDQARREAAALLDSAKSEELSPDEFMRQMQGGAVAEPARDW